MLLHSKSEAIKQAQSRLEDSLTRVESAAQLYALEKRLASQRRAFIQGASHLGIVSKSMESNVEVNTDSAGETKRSGFFSRLIRALGITK